MYMERKYLTLSNSSTLTTGDEKQNFPALMGNQAMLHHFFPVVQRMPEDALAYVPEEYRKGLSNTSSWQEMEAALISAGASQDNIVKARMAYYRGMEGQLPTFEVVRSRWPNIAEHTEEFLAQGDEEGGAILTYMEERPLAPDDPYRAYLGVQTNRDRNRLQAQTRGQQLVSSRHGRDTEIDEFPYASTYEGGIDSSIMHVPQSENRSHGGSLRGFFASSGLKDGYQFRVTVVDESSRKKKN